MSRPLAASVGVFLVALLFALAPSPTHSPVARANLALLDVGLLALRNAAPRAAPVEPVLIGIDDETLADFKFPLALWHEHFADLFTALATAKPRAVGVDVVLPERSYDFVSPGLDIKLLRAIVQLRAQSPLVLAQRVDSQGRVRPIHPPFVVAAGGPEALGLDQVPLDVDVTVRRFSETSIAASAPVATFVGQIARQVGVPVGEGIIDFTIGGEISYLPMHKVVAWQKEGDEDALKRALLGRIVLVGTVTHGEDRLAVPLRLAAFDGALTPQFRPRQPGVLVHMQAIRSLAGGGLIATVGSGWIAALAVLCLWPAWLGFLRQPGPVLARIRGLSPGALAGVAALWVAMLLALALVLLHHGWWLEPALHLLAFALALAVFAARAMRERLRLKASLAGQVSPVVMAEIMSESADDRATIKRDVCVLFSDIRGFTTVSETMSPERMTALLQRYFDAMVAEVHAHHGALDKFMGDGMMVLLARPTG